ncbi:MAG: folate-binding protein [Gammaproteobacteria bacterium]|nr:folate-binding protein [Gammaproteobacteria bacterium]
MQTDWQTFLTERGAVIEACAVQRFDTRITPRSPDTVQIFDLSDQGLLSVRGEDAENFLQGQLSSDLTHLASAATHLTSYSTPQGRMLAIMRAFRYGDSIQFLLPRELVEPVQQRLSRYVLRARVQIGSDDLNLGRIGLAGAESGELLARLALPDPRTVGAVAGDGALSVLNVTVDRPRYILVAPYERIMNIWRHAEDHAQPAGAAAWRLLQIDAGTPSIYTATSETFVPQMVNLELLGGVDFDKGCYTGQEIVARAQYLGRIKRRMFRFKYSGEITPRAGDAIVLDDGTGVGTVVDAARADSSWRMLAVIRIAVRDQPLHLAQPDGPLLQDLGLPYAIPLPDEPE